MKEQLYTIPLMDALRADDECPFCYIERNLEQHALDYVLGPEVSYMQDHVRAQTDEMGFCREHYMKMFTYGEALGNALILDTHLKKLRIGLKKEMKSYTKIAAPGLGAKIKKDRGAAEGSSNVSRWIRKQEETCYICENIKNNYERYMATFFYLYKRGEDEFMTLLKEKKGLCIHHLADVLDASALYLNEKEQKNLRDLLFKKMDENLERIQDEIDWFEKKFDYRYRDADWKTSKDVLQRGMQKIAGGYPADQPYRKK